MKHRLVIFLIALAVPSFAPAYMASYSAYDTKSCIFLSFERTAPDPSGIAIVSAYTQPVQGKGNATYFSGRVSIKEHEWIFLESPAFPLAGTTYREVRRGILKCVDGCSRNGIQYVFETSVEWMSDEPIYKHHLDEVGKRCPSVFFNE
jgi:hypothetical protein